MQSRLSTNARHKSFYSGPSAATRILHARIVRLLASCCALPVSHTRPIAVSESFYVTMLR